ncbi:MAG: PAS domain S-box protein [Rhodoferax sp.]|nr:PAS domain S-box protein [Rhodoferax sp.]
MTLIAIWLGRDHMVLLADMHRLQTETLSRTITHQKTARNLDELRRQGERVLFAGTPEERKQALLVVQLVVNSPAFVSDVKVSAVASATERFLNVSEADRRFGEGARTEWLKLTQRLSLLAGDISFEGINLGAADLKEMQTLVLLNQEKLLAALVLLTFSMLATLFLIRRTFIYPLRRIHCAIDHIDKGTETKSTVHSNIREIQAIGKSIDAQRLAQTSLRESEARLRTVFEMSLDAIILHRSGELLYVNPAAIAMFGARSEQEILDTPILALIHPDSHKIVLERVKAGTEQGIAATRLEEKYIKLDGTVFDVEAQGRPITLAGQPAVLSTLRDITERKQSEAKLQIAASVFSNVRDGIAITDADGTIIDVNESFTHITGYDRADALGQNPRFLKSGRQDANFYAAMWSDLAANGFWSGEIWNRRKDGEVYPEQLAIQARRDPQGINQGYIALFKDITERWQAQDALRHSEEKHRQLINNSHDVIFTLNAEGVFSFVSPSWTTLLGHPLSHVLELPFALFVHPDDLGMCMAALQKLFATGQGQQDIEYRVKHLNGSWRWFSANALAQKDAHQQVIAFEGIAKDITADKAQQTQMRQMAFFDALTGLPNRRMLDDRLSQAMAASKRSGLYGALMFLDLDNFKSLNDTHGHEVGDLLLIEVARRLTECLREVDTVARFGGDEFVVMLSEIDADKALSTEQAAGVAEKIRASVAEPYLLTVTQRGQESRTVVHHCSVSVGLVLFVNHEASQADIMKWADAAMYQAKEAGRNAIRFYGLSPMEDAIIDHLSTAVTSSVRLALTSLAAM